MFNNIGKKIKTLAKVVCWIGIIGGIISGLSLIAVGAAGSGITVSSNGSTSFVGGMALIIAGIILLVLLPLLAWVSSFMLYGFGDMVDNVSELKQSNEEMLNRVSNIAQNVYYSAQNKQQTPQQ
jgi:hypothetical protein